MVAELSFGAAATSWATGHACLGIKLGPRGKPESGAAGQAGGTGNVTGCCGIFDLNHWRACQKVARTILPASRSV